jgi:hypothetical protein
MCYQICTSDEMFSEYRICPEHSSLQAFASPAGLEQLAVAMWLLFKRCKQTNRQTSSDGERSALGASHSTADSTGGHPADVLSALSSLVCVSQRACDASHWRFKRDANASDDSSALLLADKLLLLVRVVVASAIYPTPGGSTPTSPCSSSGTLTVTSAKLLRDLLILTDSLTSSRRVGADHAPLDELEKMKYTLHSAIPEHLLTLCRSLSSADFIDVFNTEVMRSVSFLVYHLHTRLLHFTLLSLPSSPPSSDRNTVTTDHLVANTASKMSGKHS